MTLEMMFFAAMCASLIACWAVGGYGMPVSLSRMYAQSPRANTSGWPLTSRYSFTFILPLLLSCSHRRDKINEFIPTPVVQIIVLVSMVVLSFNLMDHWEAPVALLFRITSALLLESF